jgi:uncharacterized protein (AIM24 family)
VQDQLLGSTQPVLSISLEPGESIVAGSGTFSWMTDSIQMSTGAGDHRQHAAGRRPHDESSPRLSAYTAKEAAGTIAFASRLPGSFIVIQVSPGREYLVHRHGFVAATPGIEVTTGYWQRYGSADADDFVLRRISGRGTAWVELSGEVVKRELPAGSSLRTHPWHIGMSDASVVVQMATLPDVDSDLLGQEASCFAVVSGPGSVWLQSTSLLAARPVASGHFPQAVQGLPTSPAFEGDAGRARQALANPTISTCE